MSEISSLSELKKQLQDLGISASTPGLVGEERFKELLLRLHNARKPHESGGGGGGVNDPALVDNLKQLSMSEIRAQLSELGISTSTPGLAGEDRWNALVQRLAAAIAGRDQYTKAPPMMAPVVQKLEEPSSVSVVQNRKPPEVLVEPEPMVAPVPVVTAIDAQVDTEYQRFLDEANQQTTAEEPLEVPDFRENINDMKKILKKISNKRSMAIAAQLSGEYQDTLLKEFTELLTRVEHDIAHCEVAVTRCEHKIKLSALRSQLWKDHGQAVDIAAAVPKLTAKREELKESIKTRRQEIRHAAENHPEYGLQVEEDLKAELAQMQFTTNKVSRARRKLNDTKSIDSQLAQEAEPEPEQAAATGVVSSREDKASAQAMSKEAAPPVVIAAVKDDEEKPRGGRALGTVADDKAQETAKSFPAYAPPIPVKYRPPSSEPKRDSDATAATATMAATAVTAAAVLSAAYPSTRDDAKGRDEEAAVVTEPRRSVPLPAVKPSHRAASTPPVKTGGLAASSSSLSPVIETPSPQQESVDELTAKRRAYETYLRTGQFPTKKSAEKSPQPTAAAAAAAEGAAAASPYAVPPTTLHFSPVPSSQPPSQQQAPPPSSKPPRRASASDHPAAIIVRVQAPDAMDLDTQRSQLEIEELLRHAKLLQRADDNLAAEILLERALDMDPMNILVLQSIARFLHVKKGELARAEAFFNRALQVSQPQLYSQLTALTLQQRELNLRFSHDVDAVVSVLSPLLQELMATSTADGRQHVVGGGGGGGVQPTKLSFSPTSGALRSSGDADAATAATSTAANNGVRQAPVPSSETLKTVVEQSSSDSRFCLPHLLSLLLSFAKFLLKSKGDVDAAALLLQQAVLLAPDHAACLAQYAHFLTEHVPLKPDAAAAAAAVSSSSTGGGGGGGGGGASSRPPKPSITQQIDALFQRALQCAPGHCVFMMWYAKFLKKLKRFGPAEFMYRSAWEIAAKQQELAMERRLLAATSGGGGGGGGNEEDEAEGAEEEEEEDDPTAMSQEPTALCNYATFLFKYRPKRVRDARELFLLGVRKYPEHTGLRKNYQTLEKKLAKHPELLAQADAAPPPAQQAPPSMKTTTTAAGEVATAHGTSSSSSSAAATAAATVSAPPPDAEATRTTPPPPAAMADDDDAMPMIPTDAMASPKRFSRSAGVSLDMSYVVADDAAAMGPDSPTKQLSGHFLSPSKFPGSRQASRVGSSQMQSRGSRRAQRLQQSLAHQVPSELVTAEEKASFILERVRSANSSASNSTMSLQRLQQQQQQGSSHNSSVASLRGGHHHHHHHAHHATGSSTSTTSTNNDTVDSPPKGSSLWNVDGFTHVSDHEDDDDHNDDDDDNDDDEDEDDEEDDKEENGADHGDGDHGDGDEHRRRDGAAKATTAAAAAATATAPATAPAKRSRDEAPSKEAAKGSSHAKATSTVSTVKTKPSEHSKAPSPAAQHPQPQKPSPQAAKKTATAATSAATSAATTTTAATKTTKKPAAISSSTTTTAADGPRGDPNEEEMSYEELLRRRPAAGAAAAGVHHKETKHSPHQPPHPAHQTHHSHGKK